MVENKKEAEIYSLKLRRPRNNQLIKGRRGVDDLMQHSRPEEKPTHLSEFTFMSFHSQITSITFWTVCHTIN